MWLAMVAMSGIRITTQTSLVMAEQSYVVEPGSQVGPEVEIVGRQRLDRATERDDTRRDPGERIERQRTGNRLLHRGAGRRDAMAAQHAHGSVTHCTEHLCG